MSQGLRVFSPSGALRLEISDRMSRFVQTYVLQPFFGPSGTNQFVAVSGMENDGTWMITFPSTFYKAEVQSGGFRIWTDDYYGGGQNSYTVPVTVYRL